MGLYIVLKNKILLPLLVYFFFMWSIWQVHSTKNYLNQTTIFCHVLRISIWLQFHATNSLRVFSCHVDKWLRSENEGRNKKKLKFLRVSNKTPNKPLHKAYKNPTVFDKLFWLYYIPTHYAQQYSYFSVWFWVSPKGTNGSQLHVC